ncbi:MULTISPECIES: hypothetical protein [Pseudomonas]|uniref:hypothetical protein n=1 Tax=Pseudomonadaceae TaxID=135621 RepID=UPI0003FC4037|nr:MULTISPECIES: hypothetical protein [Pseudomonas]MDE3739882.1 hypothetical protein [Pseudomonas resinovorans]
MKANDELNLESFSLEPMESAAKAPSSPGRAKFQIDTRGGGDRRKACDRRQTIRFEQDRRQGNRRGKSSDPWDQNVDF